MKIAECKYCKLEENGDIPEDTRDILYKTFCRGWFKIQIGNSGGDFGLIIRDNRNHEIFLENALKFNYCPKCGKLLRRVNHERSNA